MASELRTLIRLAEAAGFTVERNKRDHLVFRGPDGRRVATASGSPSDVRSLKNTKAHLRRAGVPIPHKGGRINERGTNR